MTSMTLAKWWTTTLHRIGPVLAACLALLASAGVAAAGPPAPLPSTCASHRNDDTPVYSHLLALDVSQSVWLTSDRMKALLRCYTAMYVVSGEEVRLFTFGRDENGSAGEVDSFAFGPDGQARIDQKLGELEIRAPTRGTTMTYFRPIGSLLNDKVGQTELWPIVVVVSDGISDGPAQRRAGHIAFDDISLEALGRRGVFLAPGMAGFYVAVDGGRGLDILPLFTQPKPPPPPPPSWQLPKLPPAPPPSPIEPCKLEPALRVELPERLEVSRPIWPWAAKTTVPLSARIVGECAPRHRSIEIVTGEDKLAQRFPFEGVVPANTPVDRSWGLDVPLGEQEEIAVPVQVLIKEPNGKMAKLPSARRTVTIHTPSWWMVYGARAVSYGAAALAAIGGIVGLLVAGARARRRRPALLAIVGSPGTAALLRGRSISVGGETCQLAVDGARGALCLVEWPLDSPAGRYRLRLAADGRAMRVHGMDVASAIDFELGESMEVTDNEGRTHSFVITAARAGTRGSRPAKRGGGRRASPVSDVQSAAGL